MTSAVFDLASPQRIHVVGVGGAGMSAIASVLRAMGHMVSGSDLKWSPALDRLEAGGITVFVGHEASHAEGADVVTISTAVSESNPEVRLARSRAVPVMSRAQTLASICALRRCIAVSGTHGKTTTTSMLALILMEAGMRPSFIIGGDVNEIGTNALWDSGQWLVVEADESDGTFLELDPDIAVVTNVEADHLNFYGGFDELVAAFDAFMTDRPSGVIAGSDDKWAAELGARHKAELVGTAPSSTLRIEALQVGASGVSFDLFRHETLLGTISLPVQGANIASNAAVAVGAALRAGAEFDSAKSALARFAGVARRFEFRGVASGVTFVDDYAHLPSEVSAVLKAAKARSPKRIVAVFQPHRYSRIASVGEDFAPSFDQADVAVVTDVFGAGETPIPGVSGRLVADAVSRHNPRLELHYCATRSETKEMLLHILRPGDLCLTLGAGDLTSLPDDLMASPTW